MTHTTSSTLNPIRPSIRFQKTLEYLISKELNEYQGQKKSEMRVGIKFNLIADFTKQNCSFSKVK